MWSGFGIPAYDENTVPDDAVMPYITYSVSVGSIGDPIQLSASVWYRSSSWEEITSKVAEIEQGIDSISPPAVVIDGGRAYFTKGSPFAQRMSEPGDDMTRRVYLLVNAEFLTN